LDFECLGRGDQITLASSNKDYDMAMGKFSEVFPPDQMIQCDCKSWSFFDWGIQVCTQNDFGPSKRNKDMSNVKICTNCLKPVVVYDGTAYDATEYVSKDQVESLLQRGQAREHLTPVKIARRASKDKGLG
jgi:hypothetical protein